MSNGSKALIPSCQRNIDTLFNQDPVFIPRHFATIASEYIKRQPSNHL